MRALVVDRQATGVDLRPHRLRHVVDQRVMHGAATDVDQLMRAGAVDADQQTPPGPPHSELRLRAVAEHPRRTDDGGNLDPAQPGVAQGRFDALAFSPQLLAIGKTDERTADTGGVVRARKGWVHTARGATASDRRRGLRSRTEPVRSPCRRE